MQRKLGTAHQIDRRPPMARRTVARAINHHRFGLILVYEEQPNTPDGKPVLMFEAADAVVRLRSYPPRWQSLSADDLLGLILSHAE